MRTIIVFEAGADLVYAESGDFPVFPTVGFILEHAGASYTVTEAWMSPMVFEKNGDKKRAGFSKLFAIVSRLNPGKPELVAGVIAKMESIGSADRPHKVGSIELPKGNSLPEFDDLVFLRTKANGRGAAKVIQTNTLALQMFAAANPGHAWLPDTTAGGGDNIVLTADAAEQ